MNNNKLLLVIDGSYFSYYALFGATSAWQKKDPDEYNQWIKPAKETDQSNLPNIVNSESFRKILKQTVMKRCETVDWILKQNFPEEIDITENIDIIFAMDDRVSHSFRKSMYPEYKAQRSVAPKQFQLQPVKDYIVNVIFKELEIEKEHGWNLVKVDNAEGDDVIACTMRGTEGYLLKILIASDHDFLQLDGVRQFDLQGKEVTRVVEEQELSTKDYLLFKIIRGDTSDNIPSVFNRVGPKKALKLLTDKDALRVNLKEDADAASRFLLNKKLISFEYIPEDLNSSIMSKVNETLSKCQKPKEDIDLADFMTL